MYRGTERLDLHGKNRYQAKVMLDSSLRKARAGVYRILVIHGYHSGTELREMVRDEYRNHPKVLRIEDGANDGETVFVLKELY